MNKRPKIHNARLVLEMPEEMKAETKHKAWQAHMSTNAYIRQAIEEKNRRSEAGEAA